MKIYVLGNTLVKEDGVAVGLIPQLRKRLPHYEFILVDPTENWTPDEDKPLVIIDTVLGIEKVSVYNNLDIFAQNKAVSVHDYDLFLHLQLLKKLGKLPKKLVIIGVPQMHHPGENLIDQVINLLNNS